MGVKVATTLFNWSQPSVPHLPSVSQTLASSAFSSPSKRRCPDHVPLFCRYVQRLDRSTLFGSASNRLYRSRSCGLPKLKTVTIKRACSDSLDHAFSDEEYSKLIQEIYLRWDEEEDGENWKPVPSSRIEPVEPQDPLSFRMIKRKKQWREGFREAGESAYCSVKKAFSSMVFIIRELQSYSLQMRELLFYEDLQDILVRVQKEMNASFVWLFQQVFSHTPTLMVYVMILLANYSVYSMSNNTAIAATALPQTYAATTESVSVSVTEDQNFDASAIKTFSVSSSDGKTTSIGGNNGGGGKFPVVGSGTDGDGKLDGSDSYGSILPDGVSTVGNPARTSEDESVCDQVTMEDESSIWNSIVEEASGMQAAVRDESLDQETMQKFVSPVTAKIEADDSADYFRTELLYKTALFQEPTNPLLLANYAQFIFLVAQDYDRAEEYFKKAVKVEPKDAEALSKYARFLWQARNDLWAAEETYLEAISVNPSNTYYAANYAHFLWTTGGEDTCFPLTSPDTNDHV